jgi:hypothetical protein
MSVGITGDFFRALSGLRNALLCGGAVERLTVRLDSEAFDRVRDEVPVDFPRRQQNSFMFDGIRVERE